MAHRSRFLVIHNPIAGRRRRVLLRAVIRELERRGCTVSERVTGAAGDAEVIARGAPLDEFDMVVAAGGDGTVNEVVNGLVGSELLLGLIPVGTANVLSTEIGLRTDSQMVAATLTEGRLRRIYPGRLSGRRFLLMAGIGLDAEAVASVNLGLKRLWGHGAYLWSAFCCWLRHRPPDLHVVLDGQATRSSWVVVAKGRHYAGRFVFAPDGNLSDPKFQVCLLDDPGRAALLRYGIGLLVGRLAQCRGVRIVPATSISIEAPNGVPVQIDGEYAGATPLEITLDRDGVMLAMPQAALR